MNQFYKDFTKMQYLQIISNSNKQICINLVLGNKLRPKQFDENIEF